MPGVLAIAMIVVGALLKDAATAWGPAIIAAGALGLIITLVGAVIASHLGRLWSDRRSGAAGGAVAAALDLRETESLLREIAEMSALSDAARALLYHTREREALASAVDQLMGIGDYNAAHQFCDEVATRLSNESLASELRQRIENERMSVQQAQFEDALQGFEACLAARNWAGAFEEAGRIRTMYPDAKVLQHLDARVLQSREEHKRELHQQFLEATQRDEVDQAMATLKELDRYLTPEEADQLAEIAGGVVSSHREKLAALFRQAVQEHRWADAARTGTQIMQEYPNTRMATEVSGMIELLRTRASQAAVAGHR